MGVHHVEGAVRDLQSVRVTIQEEHARLDSLGAGQLQHIRADLQRGDPTGGEPPSEVDRDGAGAGTRIQQRLAGLEVRQQVGAEFSAVRHPVGAQHRLVMPVRVHAPSLDRRPAM